MVWFVNILIFISSAGLLYISGELIVNGLLRFSRLLGLKEFVVAFFVMAFAASLPNLFVGITSALEGVPELSFGDILGNNIIALTLATGIGVFFSKNREVPAESNTIQTTSLFTIASAILPILLVSDGELGRADAFVLIILFVIYVFWLFSKRERFEKVYEENELSISKDIKHILADTFKILFGVALLFLSAKGIVSSASFIAIELNLPIILIGILVVGFGSALPEVYFSISSALKNESHMIMGNLMGAVIIPATLVLGIVALINPIDASNLDFFFVSRLFVVFAALFFYFFTKTDRSIKIKEAYFLISIYFAFLFSIIYFTQN
jgi:cation:H+ antiporter